MTGSFEALVGREVIARKGDLFQGEGWVAGWQHGDTGRVELLVETADGGLVFADFREVLLLPLEGDRRPPKKLEPTHNLP